MAATLKYVKSGQRFHPPADDWNAFCDAARAHLAGLHDIGGGAAARISLASTVRIQNDAGADLDQFAPVILDDLLITFADNEAEFRHRPPVFSAVAPAEDNLGKPLAILQEPLADGKVGRALLAGVTPAQVAVSDEAHDYATLSATGLVSAASGELRILWKAAGTGTQWAVVLLGGSASGGATVRIANVTAWLASRTYTVDIYTKWQPGFTLSTADRIAEGATMKTPTLNDAAVADRITVGTKFHVVEIPFAEEGGDVSYWVPFERVGLP